MIVAVLESIAVVVLFLMVRRLAAALGNPVWASPVLVTAAVAGGLLLLTGQPVRVFEANTAPLRWLLSPAIVAFGAVVYRNRSVLRAQGWPLAAAVAGGSATGVLTAVWAARALHLDPLMRAALTTKTVSTPFAVAVAERVGGPVPLAAALAVLTGVVGALVVPPLFAGLRLRGAATTGIAMGQAAHLVGTDSLTRRDPRAAAWGAVTMVLSGVLVAIILPLVWRWLT